MFLVVLGFALVQLAASPLLRIEAHTLRRAVLIAYSVVAVVLLFFIVAAFSSGFDVASGFSAGCALLSGLCFGIFLRSLVSVRASSPTSRGPSFAV
jgi:hypothetical protein